MKRPQLEIITVDPSIPPKASVIWLHGLGADGYDFVDIVPQFKLPEDMAVRFVFPHAPIRPVTINAGFHMRAWFDIYDLTTEAKQDEEGIYNVRHLIEELIAQELSLGIASENIVLAGFSQGAAVALHCGLRYHKKLAGILALSGFLLLADKLPEEINPANKDIPILMLHGDHDDVVPVKWAERSRDILQNSGFNITWETYPMQHGVCLEEIEKISEWLQNVLNHEKA